MKTRLAGLAVSLVLTSAAWWPSLSPSASAQGRMMGGPFTFPGLDIPIDTSAFGGDKIGSETTELWANDANQACELDPLTGRGRWNHYPYGSMSRVPFNFALTSLTNADRADFMATVPWGRSQLPFKAYQLNGMNAMFAGETRPAGLADSGMDVGFGDIDADGDPEVVLASGPGVRGDVHIFKIATEVSYSFQPFGTSYTGGLRIAIGQMSRRGGATLAVGMATGSEVNLYKATAGIEMTKVGGGHPLGTGFTGGFFLAAGDANGDCIDDLGVGAASLSTDIRLFNVRPGLRGESVGVLGQWRLSETGTSGARLAIGKLKGESYVIAVTDREFLKYTYFENNWRRDLAFFTQPFGNIVAAYDVATYTPRVRINFD